MCLFPQNKSRKKVAHLGLKEKSKKSPLDLIKMDKKWHKTFVRDKISANFLQNFGETNTLQPYMFSLVCIFVVYTVYLYLKCTFMFYFSPGNLSGNRKKLKGKKFRARSNSTE